MNTTRTPSEAGGPRLSAPGRLARATAPFAPLLCVLVLAGGCATEGPRPIAAGELAEAQLFPYYPIYWVGHTFQRIPLATVDGLANYNSSVGASVYYGDCVPSHGVLGGGSCQLPLQITTLIYHPHSNDSLGAQRNIIVRGVPATVYDEGRSIEVYTGRVAIDISSDRPSRALAAAERLLPVNAPGSPTGSLPTPVFCPGLSGPQDSRLKQVMLGLPGQICKRAAAAERLKGQLSS